MLQIVNAVFKDADDDTCVSLIYANQTEEDILCRSDLEKVRDENPGRFKLWYTVDRPPAGCRELLQLILYSKCEMYSLDLNICVFCSLK